MFRPVVAIIRFFFSFESIKIILSIFMYSVLMYHQIWQVSNFKVNLSHSKLNLYKLIYFLLM